MKHLALAAGLVLLTALPAIAVTCKSFSDCRQAVIAWCSGQHPRADGDGDGIPCENVCHSLQQVNQIRAEIGC